MDVPATGDLSDDELARRAARRDHAAFERLFQRHSRPLAAWLLRRLPPDDAEDVLDDIQLRAWQTVKTYGGGSFRAWLLAVARTCLAEWERENLLPVKNSTDGSESASSHTVNVEQCLAGLDYRERELLRARFGGAEDIAAASSRLVIEPKSAQGLIGLALANLRVGMELRSPGTVLVFPTMPNEPAGLPAWLDRQVTGPVLGRLIAELSALHGPSPGPPSLATILVDERTAVLANGLSALPDDRLRLLLRNPALLAELQDVVAEAASPYWDELFDHPTLAKMVHDVVQQPPPQAMRLRAPRIAIYRRPWFVASATVVIVMMTVLMHRPPRPNWGWNNKRAIASGNTPAKHLNALADAAEQWKGQPRQKTAELRRTLREMRDGCTALLAADHRILSSEDHVWLLERSVVWGGMFDRHLADLQEGRSTDEVRAEADQTINKLIEELRERARGASDELPDS